MQKRLFKFLASLFVVAVLVIFREYQAGTFTRSSSSSDAPTTESAATSTMSITAATSSVRTNAAVIRAVDGDTLVVKLDGETLEKRVRLLGIDTPETVDPRKPVGCFGKEASAHMHALVDGKSVRLIADPQADERDKYDRLLRNVFLEDGTDLNAAMVRDGYAYAYLSFPLDPFRKRELKQLQEDAKMAGRGLWNQNTCNGNM